MVIKHNILAMNANRQLNMTANSTAKVTEKLSSGYSINRAADNAAGLSISEKMRKQIRGLSRGVQNAEDGVSVCQVADGALNEVHEMLQRINELAIQASNGTNSESDREHIDDEVRQILGEIDRIGDTTKFNDLYLFKGDGSYTYERAALPGEKGVDETKKIPAPGFDAINLNCSLTDGPFSKNSSGGHLKLAAKADDVPGIPPWELIYGNGSTSHSSIFGSYQDTNGDKKDFHFLMTAATISAYAAYESGTDKVWERVFSLQNNDGVALEIKESVTLHEKETDKQYYTISYEVENKGTEDVTYNFMHHEDTAYSNLDHVETYYLSGERKVDKYCMYTTNTTYSAYATTNVNIHTASIPSSFSIVNEKEALAFTESIVLNAGGGMSADTLVVGFYNNIHEISNYTQAGLKSILGKNAQSTDLGFSLIWTNKTLAAGSSDNLSFDQGIVKTENDPNIPDTIEPAKEITVKTGKTLVKENVYISSNLWIQSGDMPGDGLKMVIAPMSTKVMGINGLNVRTEKDADKAIDSMTESIKYISKLRSKIGAYQNRLEHTIANEDNIVENTTAAESKIRDTDMALAMVEFSNLSVLKEAGNAMLSQANQMPQGVLSLLSA